MYGIQFWEHYKKLAIQLTLWFAFGVRTILLSTKKNEGITRSTNHQCHLWSPHLKIIPLYSKSYCFYQRHIPFMYSITWRYFTKTCWYQVFFEIPIYSVVYILYNGALTFCCKKYSFPPLNTTPTGLSESFSIRFLILLHFIA